MLMHETLWRPHSLRLDKQILPCLRSYQSCLMLSTERPNCLQCNGIIVLFVKVDVMNTHCGVVDKKVPIFDDMMRNNGILHPLQTCLLVVNRRAQSRDVSLIAASAYFANSNQSVFAN